MEQTIIELENKLAEEQRRSHLLNEQLNKITRKYNEAILSTFALIEQNEQLQLKYEHLHKENAKNKQDARAYWTEIERLRSLYLQQTIQK